jgi:hypothetical protein
MRLFASVGKRQPFALVLPIACGFLDGAGSLLTLMSGVAGSGSASPSSSPRSTTAAATAASRQVVLVCDSGCAASKAGCLGLLGRQWAAPRVVMNVWQARNSCCGPVHSQPPHVPSCQRLRSCTSGTSAGGATRRRVTTPPTRPAAAQRVGPLAAALGCLGVAAEALPAPTASCLVTINPILAQGVHACRPREGPSQRLRPCQASSIRHPFHCPDPTPTPPPLLQGAIAPT